MGIKLSPQERVELAGGDYTRPSYTQNGVPRTTYYTPDGRMIQAIANLREYTVKDKDGKVIKHGTRDANLDRGWLLAMPKEPKFTCQGCSRWHDTKAEVTACIKKQKAYLEKMNVMANKEIHKEQESKDATIQTLASEVNDLKEMVRKLLEAKK